MVSGVVVVLKILMSGAVHACVVGLFPELTFLSITAVCHTLTMSLVDSFISFTICADGTLHCSVIV